MTAVLLLHAVATLYMAGLIWFVQVAYTWLRSISSAGYGDR